MNTKYSPSLSQSLKRRSLLMKTVMKLMKMQMVLAMLRTEETVKMENKRDLPSRWKIGNGQSLIVNLRTCHSCSCRARVSVHVTRLR